MYKGTFYDVAAHLYFPCFPGAITGIIIGGSAGVGVLALLYKCLPSLLKSDSTEDNRNRDERQVNQSISFCHCSK